MGPLQMRFSCSGHAARTQLCMVTSQVGMRMCPGPALAQHNQSQGLCLMWQRTASMGTGCMAPCALMNSMRMASQLV